jgi:tetratricopeptide (TPR) repeat protein
MTPHETILLFSPRLSTRISCLAFCFIFWAIFFYEYDVHSHLPLDQIVRAEHNATHPEQLKNSLEIAYQEALEKGLKNYAAYSHILIKKCYEAVYNKNYETAIIFSTYAKKISPDLPAAAKAHAYAQWSQNKLRIHYLISGYWLGFVKQLTHLESISIIVASFIFSLLGAFFITFVFFCVLIVIKYAGNAHHDLSHQLPALLPQIARRGWSLVLFLLPLFFQVSIFWIFCYWALLFYAYQHRREQIITVCFFIFLAFIPWLLHTGCVFLTSPQVKLVKALWSTNYDKWDGRQTEYIKGYTDVHPEDAEAYFSLGLIHKKEMDYQRAEFYYLKALAINPDHYPAHVNLGNIYYLTKRLDQAIDEYSKATSLQSARCVAYLNLSRAYLQKFMFTEGETAFMEARKRNRSLVEHFLATYGEHPNRQVIDETLSKVVILNKAFSAPHEHQILAIQLWDIIFSGLPFALSRTAAVIFICCAIVLLKNNRFQNARSCVSCGKAFCKKCQRITTQGSFCRQCLNIIDNKDGLDPSLKEHKLKEVKNYLRRQLVLARFFALIFPGAAFLQKGYFFSGVLLIFGFALFFLNIVISSLGKETLWESMKPSLFKFDYIPFALLAVLGGMLIHQGLKIKNAHASASGDPYTMKSLRTKDIEG